MKKPTLLKSGNLLLFIVFWTNGICQQAVLNSGNSVQAGNHKLSYSVGQVNYISCSGVTGKVRQGVQQPRLMLSPVNSNGGLLSTYLGAAGGNAGSALRKLSFTVGQPFYLTKSSSSARAREGVQQPLSSPVMLSVNVFIEGLYNGGGLMTTVLGGSISDSVRIELRRSVAPFDLITTIPLLLNVQGTAQAALPAAFRGKSYYLVVRHRNSIETWSKHPVLLNGINSLNLKSF